MVYTNNSNSNSNGEYKATSLLPAPNGPPPASPTTFRGSAVSRNISALEETASQHYIIADNLRAKAFYEDAIDEFQKALHIQEPLLGEKSLIVAKTHYGLGLAYRAIKNYGQGMFHLTKASTIYEAQTAASVAESGEETKTNGSTNGSATTTSMFQHPCRQQILDCKLNMARCHHSHGVELQRRGEYDKSIVEHRKALAIREHLLGRTHLETARTYYVLGCALSDRGDFDEALADLRRALRTRVLVFGIHHADTKEVISNLGTVLTAKGKHSPEDIATYCSNVVKTLELETEGDQLVRKGDIANGMVCFRRAMSMEEQILGDMHPTTSDLYLRLADSMTQLGDFEGALVEYRSAITIYERLMGKFHVKVATIYTRLAGILMDKGEYETALSFYAKSYGIFDAILGKHPDTVQAMMNMRLAAAKERTAKASMDLIKKAEDEFRRRQEEARLQQESILQQEAEFLDTLKGKSTYGSPSKNGSSEPTTPTPVTPEGDQV